MHKLSMKHPTTVKINGVDVPINWDFRYALSADAILNSSRLKRPENNTEKINRLLFAMYAIDIEYDEEEPEEVKTLKMQAFLEYFAEEVGVDNIEEAILQALWFLRCGEKIDESKPHEKPVLDFSHDAQDIRAAFLAKPNPIDLDEINYMHWWKFMLHFMELPEGVRIGRKAYLRKKVNKSEKLSEEEKKEIKRYGKEFQIPNEDEQEAKEYWNSKLPD